MKYEELELLMAEEDKRPLAPEITLEQIRLIVREELQAMFGGKERKCHCQRRTE